MFAILQGHFWLEESFFHREVYIIISLSVLDYPVTGKKCPFGEKIIIFLLWECLSLRHVHRDASQPCVN